MFDSKKLPFCLACSNDNSKEEEPYKIMFKYGDDIKQDHLVLQIFQVFDKLWTEGGLDLKMNNYKVLSTGN
jgi:phosphatidylinositol kinase/protein kinase (PI-3  family)